MDDVLASLVDRVRRARAERTPLAIAGGGTKAFYGEAPQGEPLDLRPLAGISSHEPTELVVTVRAGTPLAVLEETLAAHGQALAFEPPHFAPGGTVGGMVAAGLSGPSRMAAGSVRDHLLGATLLDGRGEVLSFGGQVMKNVAGYDVARLLAGSMGTLGVILEVSLKVLPVPPATATLRFALDEDEALRRLNEWAGRPLPLNASAWWNGTLVLRLSGARAAVDAAAATLGGDPIAPAQAAAFWQGLRDHTDEFFDADGPLWRLALPSTAAPIDLPGRQLVEWGGAQRWWITDAPVERVREAARRAGGHATLFRATPKPAGVFTPLSPALLRIHRSLKAGFDPDGVFNPGRLVPDL